MRNVTLLTIGLVGTWAIAIQSCSSDPTGEAPAVASGTAVSVASGDQSSTTGGGTSGDGGAGQGGNPSAGGSTPGAGGQGGDPPEPECGDGTINQITEECDDGNTSDDDGCNDKCKEEFGWICEGSSPTACTLHECSAATATDMTGMANVALAFPFGTVGQTQCVRVSADTTIDFNVASPTTDHRIMHGVKMGTQKFPLDPATSPFYNGTHYCSISPYDCGDMPAFTLADPGVYPFFDDKLLFDDSIPPEEIPTPERVGVIFVE